VRATTRALIAIVFGVAQVGVGLLPGRTGLVEADGLRATARIQQVVGQAGASPVELVVDGEGLTGHLASLTAARTVVSILKSPLRVEDGVGLVFFNPATGDVKWYPPIVGGAVTGLDVDRGRAARAGAGETFQSGDVWVSARSSSEDPAAPSLFVNFRGSDRFRVYRLPGGVARPRIGGLAVEPATGLVYFVDQRPPATINRLDPATNVVTSWVVGGLPHDLAIDPRSGLVYATVSGATIDYLPTDAVVRLDPLVADPSAPNLTAWSIPGPPGFSPFPAGDSESPTDDVDVDDQGNVWFVQSQARQVGRLEPGAGMLTELDWAELTEPRPGRRGDQALPAT
jgi:streptogramin lyase